MMRARLVAVLALFALSATAEPAPRTDNIDQDYEESQSSADLMKELTAERRGSDGNPMPSKLQAVLVPPPCKDTNRRFVAIAIGPVRTAGG